LSKISNRDVRDKSSIHVPSLSFEENVGDLFENVVKDGVTEVIFHCQLSQRRGPRCARTFEEFVRKKDPDNQIKITVLKGGMEHFENSCADTERQIFLEKINYK